VSGRTGEAAFRLRPAPIRILRPGQAGTTGRGDETARAGGTGRLAGGTGQVGGSRSGSRRSLSRHRHRHRHRDTAARPLAVDSRRGQGGHPLTYSQRVLLPALGALAGAAVLWVAARAGAGLRALADAARPLPGRATRAVRAWAGLLSRRSAGRCLGRVDPLTGVASRAAFARGVETATGGRGAAGDVAVVVADVDRFADVNAVFGGAAGDEVLRELARRFGGTLRPGDLLGRVGADQFAALLAGTDERGAVCVADRMRRVARRPVVVGETAVPIMVRVGVAARAASPAPGEPPAPAGSPVVPAPSIPRQPVPARGPAGAAAGAAAGAPRGGPGGAPGGGPGPAAAAGRAPDAGPPRPAAASGGPAASREPGREPDSDLLRDAELAVAEAKRRRVVYHVHRPGRSQVSAGHFELRSGVATALRERQIEVRYQPKADLRGGRITGVEALARWRHPVDGVRPPGVFLAEMDRQGLMPELTRHILTVALADCARWRATGEPMSVSVNVPPNVLALDGFSVMVSAALRAAGLPPWALCLEITENTLMDAGGSALATLAGLRSDGVRISLDDFGTGYSSLSYLREIPADELKLDSSFLTDLEHDGTGVATEIIRAVVDLAHAVGMRVVVEGVESSRTWAVLAALGADEAQGFWVSRPVPREHLPAVLGEWAGRALWSDFHQSAGFPGGGPHPGAGSPEGAVRPEAPLWEDAGRPASGPFPGQRGERWTWTPPLDGF